jgi:hypothetical protein
LSHESHILDAHYPAVQLHPAFTHVVQIFDRKRLGRMPSVVDSFLDIPATYFVLRANGDTECPPLNKFSALLSASLCALVSCGMGAGS